MPLKGTGVWVTRPRERSQKLCDLIADAGGIAYGSPVIEIKPLSHRVIRNQLRQLATNPWNGIVVTSGYAAELGLSHLGLSQSDDTPKLFAVGEATKQKVEELGFRAQSSSEHRDFTSEGLLASPELQKVSGESWLIVKGEGGRSTLARTLSQRGANTQTLEVYTRIASEEIPREIVKHLQKGDIHWVTVTSVDILKHLIELLGPQQRHLEKTTLVVPSDRVKEQVKRLVPKAFVRTASSATDEDMVTCMIKTKAEENQP